LDKTSITIYDVARMADVSTSTVSRVLNGNVKVSEEKAERVRKIVDQYHFTLNPLAQNFYKQKTKNIGVIVPDIRNAFYSTLYVECEKEAQALGYRMILCNTMNNQESEIEQIISMSQQRVDMILQAGGGADEVAPNPAYVSVINRIQKKTPVIVTSDICNLSCFRIVADDDEGMKQALQYLFSLGHKAIALVGGSRGILPTYRKYQSFSNHMKIKGYPVYEPWMIEADYSVQGGYQVFAKLMEQTVRPTAVITINDEVGFGFIQAAKEQGLSVPDDFSVIGFDNTCYSTFTNPQLTTVDYDYSTFAKHLLDVIGEVENKQEPSIRTVKGKLVVRASCRKVADS